MRRQSARPVTDTERRERLGYVVLQHLDTLVGDATGSLAAEHIAADLAIPAEELREILDMLAVRGFIDWDGTRGPALPTPRASEYLARVAGRRRSVRFHSIGRREMPLLRRPSREPIRYRNPERARDRPLRPERRLSRTEGD